MTQYLSLSEKNWRKCPICYESIYAHELKPAFFQETVKLETVSIDAPQIIDFVLMKRDMVCFVVILGFNDLFAY